MAICSLFLLLSSAIYAAGAVLAKQAPDYRERGRDDLEPADLHHEYTGQAEEEAAADAPLLVDADRSGRSSRSN